MMALAQVFGNHICYTCFWHPHTLITVNTSIFSRQLRKNTVLLGLLSGTLVLAMHVWNWVKKLLKKSDVGMLLTGIQSSETGAFWDTCHGNLCDQITIPTSVAASIKESYS